MDIHAHSVAPDPKGPIATFAHLQEDFSWRSRSAYEVITVQARQSGHTSPPHFEYVVIVGNAADTRFGKGKWTCDPHPVSLPPPPPWTLNLGDKHLRASVARKLKLVDHIQSWPVSASSKGVPLTVNTTQGKRITGAKLYIARANAQLVQESTSFHTHDKKGRTYPQAWRLDDSKYGRPVHPRLPVPCHPHRALRTATPSFSGGTEANPLQPIIEYMLAGYTRNWRLK